MFDTLRQSENPFLAPMFLLPLTKTGNLTMDREQAQREAGGKGRRIKLNEDAGNKVSHSQMPPAVGPGQRGVAHSECTSDIYLDQLLV